MLEEIMPKTERFRALYVLKYLREHTDEEHPVTLLQIQDHLSAQNITAIPRTIDIDITALQKLGFDIIRNRSTQNQYFFASRHFSSFELKLMIDAVQAAKFIPREHTKELVERISGLANKIQSGDLRRNLFVSKLKDNDKNTLTMADWLNTAINQNKQVTFQYYGYDREGKKALRFDGYRYKFSPYALVWNMDSYFVIGCRMRKDENCIHKFRVDKICAIQMEEEERLPLPEGFDLAAYCDSAFLMYGDATTDVTLSCTYDVMEKVINRFGEDILILPGEDDEHFQISEPVVACSTFYSWVFNYGGKIKIIAPEEAKQEFQDLIRKFM